jgi:hypothetical protein
MTKTLAFHAKAILLRIRGVENVVRNKCQDNHHDQNRHWILKRGVYFLDVHSVESIHKWNTCNKITSIRNDRNIR